MTQSVYPLSGEGYKPHPGSVRNLPLRKQYDSSEATSGVEELTDLDDFIPSQCSGKLSLRKLRIIRLSAFDCNILMTLHQAHRADFETFRWLIQFGITEVWCEQPQPFFHQDVSTVRYSGPKIGDPRTVNNPFPVKLDIPRVWASSALTDSSDDKIQDCTSDHVTKDDLGGSFAKCDTLEATSLIYCIILSSFQARDLTASNHHLHGRQIFKLIKCGSRDAAIAEVLCASVMYGWNVAFSCVMREDENFPQKQGIYEKVGKLGMLAGAAANKNVIRVFY